MRMNSKKPRKQRNKIRDVPHHQVHKLFTVPLAISLQEIWGVKRLPLRKDDEVRVVKGEFKGIEGKILELDKKKRRITIEECTLEKRSGETIYIPISVSKVMLIKFAEEKGKIDPWREKIIARKSKLELLEEVEKER